MMSNKVSTVSAAGSEMITDLGCGEKSRKKHSAGSMYVKGRSIVKIWLAAALHGWLHAAVLTICVSGMQWLPAAAGWPAALVPRYSPRTAKPLVAIQWLHACNCMQYHCNY
jgi:hypothetical protein